MPKIGSLLVATLGMIAACVVLAVWKMQIDGDAAPNRRTPRNPRRDGGGVDRFDGVSLNDVAVEIQSVTIHGRSVQRAVAASIMGEALTTIRHPELRIVCSKLGVGGYKNKRKDEMAMLIAAKKLNEEIYDVTAPRSSEHATTIHCRFRLLNILFSDEFAEAIGSLGDTITRQDLDGAIKREDKFWQSVHSRFVDSSSIDIGKTQFTHAAFDSEAINPAHIVRHMWSKLRSIYQETRTLYKAALDRSKRSGEHGEFYEYCNGRVDTLYHHLHIQRRPHLSDTVDAELPLATFLDSEAPCTDLLDCDSASSAGTPAKRRRTSGVMMADALNSFVEHTMRSDTSQQRAAYYMARDARESAKSLREQQQHEQQTALLRLEEWEKLSDQIRSLQREMKREEDAVVRSELENDIAVLLAWKRQINI